MIFHTPEETLRRARAALELSASVSVVYELGRGGYRPGRSYPWSPTTLGLDCSGFVAWSLGVNRDYPAIPGGWIETSMMVADASSGRVVFEECSPALGVVVVYGDADGKQGHTGIVSGLEPLRVIHCSSGVYRRTGNALGETRGEFFLSRGAIFVRESRRGDKLISRGSE